MWIFFVMVNFIVIMHINMSTLFYCEQVLNGFILKKCIFLNQLKNNHNNSNSKLFAIDLKCFQRTLFRSDSVTLCNAYRKTGVNSSWYFIHGPLLSLYNNVDVHQFLSTIIIVVMMIKQYLYNIFFTFVYSHFYF